MIAVVLNTPEGTTTSGPDSGDGRAGRPDDPESWLRRIAARFPNGSINIFDRELRYIFAEGERLRAVGLLPGGLVGKRLADVFSAESVAYVEPFYHRAFCGESVRFELPVFDRVYSIGAGPLNP